MSAAPKITFGIVAYHEETLIRRCLESIAPVADEIILIHDGPCTDKTLEIAQEFTDQIIVGERIGGSDPHRLQILEQARNDWIFMIDADEFLSPALRAYVQEGSDEYTHYAALAVHWPLWDGRRYVTHHNWRTVLFDRRQCWAIGLHNFPIQPIGPVLRKPLVLEHKPAAPKAGLSRLFGAQMARRIERDARTFLNGVDQLSKYNSEQIPESFVREVHALVDHPIRAMMIRPIKHFLGSLRATIWDGWHGISISIILAVYQFRLARTIARLKRTSHE